MSDRAKAILRGNPEIGSLSRSDRYYIFRKHEGECWEYNPYDAGGVASERSMLLPDACPVCTEDVDR